MATCSSTSWVGVPGSGSSVMWWAYRWPRPVPEHLQQREHHLLLGGVRRIGRVQPPVPSRSLGSIGRPPQSTLRLSSGRVVHARHAEHAPLRVRGERHVGAAHDRALAVAVVDQRRAWLPWAVRIAGTALPSRAGPGRRGRRRTRPGAPSRGQVHEVEEPLLRAVGDGLEAVLRGQVGRRWGVVDASRTSGRPWSWSDMPIHRVPQVAKPCRRISRPDAPLSSPKGEPSSPCP